jgi:hypothetical protein
MEDQLLEISVEQSGNKWKKKKGTDSDMMMRD